MGGRRGRHRMLSRRQELPHPVPDASEQDGGDHGGERQPDRVTTARLATASRCPVAVAVAVASEPVSPGHV